MSSNAEYVTALHALRTCLRLRLWFYRDLPGQLWVTKQAFNEAMQGLQRGERVARLGSALDAFAYVYGELRLNPERYQDFMSQVFQPEVSSVDQA